MQKSLNTSRSKGIRPAARPLRVLLVAASVGLVLGSVLILRPWEGGKLSSTANPRRDVMRAQAHLNAEPARDDDDDGSAASGEVQAIGAAKGEAHEHTAAPLAPPAAPVAANAAEKAADVRPSSVYTAAVNALIVEELGIDLATAIYDPLFIDDASTLVEETEDAAAAAMAAAVEQHGPQLDPSSLYLTEQNSFTYVTARRAPRATIPATMSTVGMQLACLKQAMSLGLGRLARDGRLAEGFEGGDVFSTGRRSAAKGSAEAARARQAYERPLRQVIRGFANYAVGYLQNTIDGEEGMPMLRNWARTANNAYAVLVHKTLAAKRAAAAGQGQPDPLPPIRAVNDPIVFPHLDPLLILMQIVRTRPAAPASADEAVAATDGAAGRILQHARHLRGAAAKVLGDSLGLGEGASVYGLEGAAPSFRTNPTTLEAYAKVLKGSLIDSRTTGASLSYLTQRRKQQQPAPIVADAVLDVVGFANAVWGYRRDLLSSIGALRLEEEGAAHTAAQFSLGAGATRGLFASRAHYALQYFSNIVYKQEQGAEGKFWNSIRPVLGCSGLAKQCELADGCRYTCNFDYLLGAEARPPPSAGNAIGASSSTPMRYAHQAIGIGSNNEFGWELGMADAFKRAAAVADAVAANSPDGGSSSSSSAVVVSANAPFALPNVLGRVTVFDCTLDVWQVPKFLSEGNVGFGRASYCFANRDSPPRPRIEGPRNKTRDTTSIPAALSYTSLRQFINSDGLYPGNYEGSSPSMARSERAPNPYVKRYPTHAQAVLNTWDTEVVDLAARAGAVVPAGSGRWGAGDSSKAVPSPLYVDYSTFDELAVFKIDVEWFEHSTFPNFARAELLDLQRHRRQQPTSSIYFDVDAPNTATFGQFQVEIHRVSARDPSFKWPENSYPNSVRMHYVLMQLYAMGSVVFAQEKNPFRNCCYELALTHYRHFVRSEIWHSEKQ